MIRFRDLSLRYKIPLRVVALVLCTAFAITASLVLREYDELKRDLVRNAETMGRVLANTLVVPLAHDDTWRAFEIVKSPFSDPLRQAASQDAEVLVVLDVSRRVYVSTRPDLYPILSDPLREGGELAGTADAIRAATGPVTAEPPDSNRLYMIVPVVSDDAVIGTLVLGYSKAAFWPRFLDLMRRAGLVTLAVLAVLLPASWYWGGRTGAPLMALANAMHEVGTRPLHEVEFKPYAARDEIGSLGHAFQRMIVELREKENMEKEMMGAERLAALGRLAAGVAHEINNPLGGMLNAISTFRRHGNEDPMTLRTLSLLERGLVQIKDTVAALLVEAKVESHALTRQDIEDARTLVQPTAHRKQVDFVWRNEAPTQLPLPSTLVRQVLINLLLNAVQAIEPRGHVRCHVYRRGETFHIVVANDGRHIPSEELPYLFEPFSRLSRDGHGLGLWVTYQIVQQLAGEISVQSEPGDTAFAVTLPLKRAA
jgi:signal transduction histidine kinase